jgi:hypothetical protein
VGSSHRRFAIFTEGRRAPASLVRVSLSIQMPRQDSFSIAGSPRLPGERGHSQFRRQPCVPFHLRESALYAKLFSTKLPCFVASRNPEESIV